MPNEAFGLFDTAIEVRKCELGMVDCSSGSFTMLMSCQFVSETCGMDVINLMLFGLTGFETIFIEKYLTFLRAIN